MLKPQCHCYTFLMVSCQLLNISDEDLEEHVRTQPLEALNWAEYNSRIFYVLTISRNMLIMHLPDFFT
jgi:ABC-type lipoprotein release transport system permease subunit